MDTRRGFIKRLFGIIGGLTVLGGSKKILGKTPKIEHLETDAPGYGDFNAGVRAAVRAGKLGPTLGWTCKTRLNQHQRPLSGKIQNIDFKNKTITVHCDALIAAEEAGRTRKPFGNKPAFEIHKKS